MRWWSRRQRVRKQGELTRTEVSNRRAVRRDLEEFAMSYEESRTAKRLPYG